MTNQPTKYSIIASTVLIAMIILILKQLECIGDENVSCDVCTQTEANEMITLK